MKQKRIELRELIFQPLSYDDNKKIYEIIQNKEVKPGDKFKVYKKI
jgi:hypothetical protein